MCPITSAAVIGMKIIGTVVALTISIGRCCCGEVDNMRTFRRRKRRRENCLQTHFGSCEPSNLSSSFKNHNRLKLFFLSPCLALFSASFLIWPLYFSHLLPPLFS
ncbi:hypothetical protein BX666DRAFT_165509 [Dichotomocladium elegans]|nr:hypothetical protein BX666DRAFT_165509 [Dichotomocladium elegans]